MGKAVGAWPHQWLQLPLVHQAELLDEVVEVLVAGVDVRLGAHLGDAVEVVDVDVHEHTEQARQDLPHHLQEVLGERRACTREGSPGLRRADSLLCSHSPPGLVTLQEEPLSPGPPPRSLRRQPQGAL